MLLDKWLINTSRLKKDAQNNNSTNIDDAFIESLSKIVEKSYISNLKDPDERASLVLLKDSKDSKDFTETVNNEDAIINDGSGTHHIIETKTLDEVFDSFIITQSKLDEVFVPSRKQKNRQKNLISRSEAILQILDSYNLLENLTVEKQERLVLDLIEVLSVEV